MIDPIKDKTKCCACGACINICHHNAITMSEDEYGFMLPTVDVSKCVDCGLCEKVCPMNITTPPNKPIVAYASSWNSQNIVKSASGGVFAALASYIIQKKGIVFGCTLENIKDKHTPIIKSVCNLEDLQSLLGSKYVQADTLNTYNEVKELLNKNFRVLYSGTPCQIAGLKRFLRRDYDNLITVDLICHGTPNMKMFQSYISYIENKEQGAVKDFVFRDKSKGWGTFYYRYSFLTKKNKLKIIIREYTSSVYYRLFLSSAIYRDSCYYCPYATLKRISDITIGDFWGIEKEYPELDISKGGKLNFKKGISCVFINTERGSRVWSEIQSMVSSIPVDIDKIVKYNHQLETPSSLPPLRQIYLDAFKSGGYSSLVKIFYKEEWKSILRMYLFGWIPFNLKLKIKSLFK